MIIEKTKFNKPNWDEKITLELSLEDLQVLYDCVGSIPWRYIKLRHERTSFKNRADKVEKLELYDSLEEILKNHNGLIDYDDIENNLNLNLNLVLENLENDE